MDLYSVDGGKKIIKYTSKYHRKLESDNTRKKTLIRGDGIESPKGQEGQGQEKQGRPEKVEEKAESKLTQ